MNMSHDDGFAPRGGVPGAHTSDDRGQSSGADTSRRLVEEAGSPTEDPVTQHHHDGIVTQDQMLRENIIELGIENRGDLIRGLLAAEHTLDAVRQDLEVERRRRQAAETAAVADQDRAEAAEEMTRNLGNALAEALRRLRTDELTGLPNRVALAEDWKVRQPAALIILDLDEFKVVNDTWGHPYGNAILQKIGRRLGGSWRCARLSGDEYVLLVDDASRLEETCAAAAGDIALPIVTPTGDTMVVRASFGAVVLTGPLPVEWALTRADVAMYHTKAAHRRGENRIVTLWREDLRMPRTRRRPRDTAYSCECFGEGCPECDLEVSDGIL